MDQDQEDPPVAEAGDGVADDAPAINADLARPAVQASRATTRMAFTPRPWTTPIAPRCQGMATARAGAGSAPASLRLSLRSIQNLYPPCAKIPPRASLPLSTICSLR